MKKFFMFIFVLFFISCSSRIQDDSNTICDCNFSKNQDSLPWLNELIQKEKTDTTSNYLGCIWLENFKGKDIFVTNMMFGSGGIMNWFFDCEGNHYSIGETEKCGACHYVGKKHLPFPEDFIFPTFEIKKDVVIFAK